MELKIQITSDQSQTLYNAELDETYHSVHGALRESQHVYIKSGLEEFKDKDIVRIFEMGFGTGLNVLLTWIYSQDHQQQIDFNTIELYPLKENIWRELTYAEGREQQELFTKLHSSEWEIKSSMDERFSLLKNKVSLSDFPTGKTFDLIYFDAFGPEVQPELWKLPVFEKLFNMLDDGGVLVTYSAKGQVRRDMQTAGFTVERLQGPPGKREMLRGRRVTD
jgi:tRNA U34 5-methylaminomethyl-2-thiouridine-forming methyltransferase MnmC